MRKLPINIGNPVPIARTKSNPPASPLNMACPMVEKAKALNPKPASTVPVADALVLSGKDFATTLTDAERPADPPAPVINMQKARRKRRMLDGADKGSDRMGIRRV